MHRVGYTNSVLPATWTLTGLNAGTVGSIAFGNVENLVGSTRNDTFQVANGGSLAIFSR